MAIKNLITDSSTGDNALVLDNALVVSQYTCPPLLQQKNRICRCYLTDTSGSNDMGVDGSTTPKEYFLSAFTNDDRYVTTLNFSMGYGVSGQPYMFADTAGALTNGCQLYYETLTHTVYIHDAIKRNQDLMRLGVRDILPTAWEVRGIGANNDYGYMVTVDLKAFIPPYGIKLDRGTSQRLVFKIRDDCSDADTFDCIAYGFQRFE